MTTETNTVTEVFQAKCQSCGGIMQYSPEDEGVKCIYCGHTDPLDCTPVKTKENDFDYWKSQANNDCDVHENTAEEAEIKCQQCGATTSLPVNVVGIKCAFCGTPLIINEASVKRTWQPEYILPFKLSEKASHKNFKTWLKKKWFLDADVKKNGVLANNFKGVYLPFWTYDANTHTDYTGEQGLEKEEVTENKKGERVKHITTEWHKTSGSVDVSFDDILIPASNTLTENVMRGLTNWDLNNCVTYKKEFIAGFITERYQKNYIEAMDDAKEKMEDVIEEAILEDIGGDDQWINTRDTCFKDVKFNYVLLPVWISTFKHKDKLYQFVVNGRTGQVIGQYPKDKTKIIMIIVFIIALVLALTML